MNEPVAIDYYSDILCVWAWIAQRRVDELTQQYGNKIRLRYRYINIFGDTSAKMDTQWSDRGSFEGFGKHVHDSVYDYEHVHINHNIWRETRPTTSANAHLWLKAVELAYSPEMSSRFARCLREAFFIEAIDISNQTQLASLASSNQLDIGLIEKQLHDGNAIAALMTDYHEAQILQLKGSPSYIMDNGRQTLYGNVGYRILSANVEELLKRPVDEASWC